MYIEILLYTFYEGPTKRRSQSGSTSILGGGIDSPCSSRASVAGSSCSEPWSTSSNGGTVEDAANVSQFQGKIIYIYYLLGLEH